MASTNYPKLKPGPGKMYISGGGLKRPILVILAENPPTVTSGYSIWNEITRPKRRTVVDWQGLAPFRMDVSFYFDKWSIEQSVEDECWQLENLAIPRSPEKNPPPRVKLFGAIPHKDLEWFIENISWEDVIYSKHGWRTRQKVTVTFVQALDLPNTLINETRRPARNNRGYRIVTVKKGQNLGTIASIFLKSPQQWRRILRMNGTAFRDPVVPAGTKVKVPRE